jgi:hypothetical protein
MYWVRYQSLNTVEKGQKTWNVQVRLPHHNHDYYFYCFTCKVEISTSLPFLIVG